MIPSPSDDAPRVSAALASLVASGPLPRLTWTGVVDGTPERLELSGRVSATWANKVANLLVEEIDAGPGTRVVVDLPLHWRTLTWATGAWLTGATVVVTDSTSSSSSSSSSPDRRIPTTQPADAVVTASVALAEEAIVDGVELVVLVPMPSFALRVIGGVPAGALDGAADVAAQPDDLGPVRTTDATRAALELAGRTWTFADLFGRDEPSGIEQTWWAAVAVREWSADADVVLEGPG